MVATYDRGMARDQHGDRDAVRITTASASRKDDISRRQRRYVISMSIRTVCFVAAILVEGWLRWTLVVAALLLPYVAVVMANAVNSKDDDFALRDAENGRRELPLPPDPKPDTKSDNI